MKLQDMSVGQRLWHWHDTGAMGARPVYSTVLKLGKKKVQVQDEFGNKPIWKYPHFFDGTISEQRYQEIMNDCESQKRTEGSQAQDQDNAPGVAASDV